MSSPRLAGTRAQLRLLERPARSPLPEPLRADVIELLVELLLADIQTPPLESGPSEHSALANSQAAR